MRGGQFSFARDGDYSILPCRRRWKNAATSTNKAGKHESEFYPNYYNDSRLFTIIQYININFYLSFSAAQDGHNGLNGHNGKTNGRGQSHCFTLRLFSLFAYFILALQSRSENPPCASKSCAWRSGSAICAASNVSDNPAPAPRGCPSPRLSPVLHWVDCSISPFVYELFRLEFILINYGYYMHNYCICNHIVFRYRSVGYGHFIEF